MKVAEPRIKIGCRRGWAGAAKVAAAETKGLSCINHSLASGCFAVPSAAGSS